MKTKRRNIKRKTIKTRKQKGGSSEDETQCKFVSSHGIMKGSKEIKGVYYVKSDHLDSFTIPNEPFVLVTGDEDTTMIEDIKEKAEKILNSPNLIHWYAQNLTKHDNHKLSIIPIGLDYHTIAQHKAGYEWWGAKETPVQQEKIINTLNRVPFEKRELKIYCNFLQTIRGKYGGKDRKEALEQVPSELLVKEEGNIPRNQTWEKFSKYAFILSPHGNGLDCHRTWEALVLGCIPIVKKSPIDILYEDLPVLIVNNWSDISKDLLLNTIEEFKNKKFNLEKLQLSYWLNKIKNSFLKQSGGDHETVVALCSNKAYLDKAIFTIDGLRGKGEYTGDIVFFYDEDIDDNDESLTNMKEKYNIILKKFPRIDTSNVLEMLNKYPNSKYEKLRNKMFQYHKFYIFDPYFKSWKKVLYIDSGMHIFNPINRLFKIDVSNALLAHSDSYPEFGWSLNGQFNLDNEYVNSLKKEFNITKKDYFQSGLLLFDSNIIQEDTTKNLIDLMNAYPIGNGDQAIMNLYFLNKLNIWKSLPVKNNIGFTYNYQERNGNRKEKYIMLKYPTT